MKKYEISHAEAAWPSSALVIAGSSVCIAVSQLQNKVSVYHITLVGGLLASLGLVASAFAPTISWMTFTLGVLHGAGIGTALLGFSLYILLYFEKYSGTAFAIMWVARSISGMAGTPLLWHLANTYGIEGCLLITGGVVLHVVPFTMFIKSPSPTRIRFCAVAKCREVEAYNPDAHNLLSSKTKQLPKSENVPKVFPPTNRQFASRSSFSNTMSSMRTWPFYVAVLYSAMSEYLFATFNATVVAYGIDKGCTLEDSKQVVIYNSVGLLIGRVAIPFATDKISSSRCPAAVASFLAATICFLVLAHVSSYAGLVAGVSIMGVAQGYVLCIKSLIVSDHVGLECFSFCCGVGGLLSLPLWLSGPSIIGFFRDKNGSYDFLYVMLAVMCFIQAVLLGLLTWREAMHRRQPRGQRFNDANMPELQHTKEPCVI